jgi:hypothetical protein
MEQEELDMFKVKKCGPVSKRNANDRSADIDADEIQGREDEGDDTVFIDNLPKDEFTLRKTIEEVNYHIRDLEKQFFVEEDSEEEAELKQNVKK